MAGPRLRLAIPLPLHLVFCMVSLSSTLYLFTRGFFPYKAHVPGIAQDEHLTLGGNSDSTQRTSPVKIEPLFDKLVVVVIDALRADFVLPGMNSDRIAKLSFLESRIESGEARAFLATAHSPTVTLPRIKALLTGSIPEFVDVAMNFDSSELHGDSLLTQFQRRGKEMVFYGDDTWLKLFPRTFLRTDGTSSFFVADYTEVDHNVSRHLDFELARDDWDVMILHYLGLDHIGHLAGPYSPLVPAKLNEMGAVLEKIHTALQKKEQSAAKTGARDLSVSRPNLLAVCGDHGMSEQGSHGGSTFNETATPLVFLSSLFEKKRKPPSGNFRHVQQIDFAPTISSLFALPVPQNSLGVVIDEMLEEVQQVSSRLHLLYRNSLQLLRLARKNVPEAELLKLENSFGEVTAGHLQFLNRVDGTSSEFIRLIERGYRQFMASAQSHLSSRLSEYDTVAIVAALLLFWCTLASTMSALLHGLAGRTHVALLWPSLACFILQLVSAFGMLYALAHYTAVLVQLTTINLLCWLSSAISWLFHVNSIWTLFNGARFLESLKRTQVLISFRNLSTVLPVFAALVHVLSLSSSSFVEEEHQTFYYACATAILCGFWTCIGHIMSSKLREYSACNDIFEMNGEVSDQNSALSKNDTRWQSNLENLGNCISNAMSEAWRWIDLVYIIVIFILNRFLRSWNQTGVKWSHLWDVSDYFQSQEHSSVLMCLALLCTCITVFLVTVVMGTDRVSRSLLALGGLAVAKYRVTKLNMVSSEFLSPPAGTSEARFVYLLTSLTLLYCIVRSLRLSTKDSRALLIRDSLAMWTILGLLLAQHHNTLVTMVTCIEQTLLIGLFLRDDGLRCLPVSSIALLVLFFGESTFFAHGNSNSLATVDIPSGYVGLTDYDPNFILILLSSSTFHGPVSWFLCGLLLVSSKRESKSEASVANIMLFCYSAVSYRAFLLAFYTTVMTVHMHHLFIWSVFAPKFMYECIRCGVLFAFIFAISVGVYFRG